MFVDGVNDMTEDQSVIRRPRSPGHVLPVQAVQLFDPARPCPRNIAWAGSQRKAGGFYRIRKTEQPANLPTEINATKSGVTLTLSDSVDAKSIKPDAFRVKAWDLKRTRNYGSKHYNEREWKVTKAVLNGNKVTLTIPDLEPTWGMSIEMKLTGKNGEKFTRVIHNSIFELPE